MRIVLLLAVAVGCTDEDPCGPDTYKKRGSSCAVEPGIQFSCDQLLEKSQITARDCVVDLTSVNYWTEFVSNIEIPYLMAELDSPIRRVRIFNYSKPGPGSGWTAGLGVSLSDDAGPGVIALLDVPGESGYGTQCEWVPCQSFSPY